ncbi:uncharacterized protein RHOBADRAFT_54055 [Rhodotorula graminis WP1]|uniref:ELMO domain-containing protein n=1 Tax=Rhodotorula graminis (strain WP1) TaxID=578459 RepID=A0A194S0F1_RHOGW|nr:uncharacterized protein RHOBADRAFT_54055 [Rhodotorula graminis WP1]KPV74203.1 hypothetical protein RHOBADRAFT_54055 [Rhodotorula graminis WP1]
MATPPRAHYFHYGQRNVKARIDPEVPLDEILRQLCAAPQLAVTEPPALFALRERDSGTLVTKDNMRSLLGKATTFQLVSSPRLEAVELIDKLSSTDPAVLKPATFSLRTRIQERAFLDQFVARRGVAALQGVVGRSSGNTLAYALLSLQTLLELENDGWGGLDRAFVARVVDIIATERLINITRPATAILRRLASQPILAPSSPSTSAAATAASRSGFVVVFEAILVQPDFLRIVVERLAGGDVEVTNLSLALLDTLLRGSTELGDLRLADELDTLDAWRAIGKLLDGTKGADLNLLLSLQSNLVASLRLAFATPIAEEHFPHFDQLWIASRLDDVDESNRWRRLGFVSESPQWEFSRTGLLGLKALRRFADEEQNEFSQTLQDQAARPESRRCPLSTLSNSALVVLGDYFALASSSTPPSPSTSPSPYLFRFYDLHALVVQFLVRLWTESDASLSDLERIAALGRSQVAFVLGPPPQVAASSSAIAGGAVQGGGARQDKTWFTIRSEFLTAEYRQVRERQMREMEIEDDLLSKAPVRNLRGRLYLESFEFVRNQRIMCLHEGAWFLCSPSSSSPPSATSSRRPSGSHKVGAAAGHSTWRFYRLAESRKTLHWREATERRTVRPGLEELPEKIDVAMITDVVPSTSSSANQQRPLRVSQVGGLGRPGSSTWAAPPSGPPSRISFLSSKEAFSNGANPSASATSLSFTLVGAHGPLATLAASSPSLYSEWLDGLSLLLPNGAISTPDTAAYVQALTEIAVKVKLLDLSGERVEVQTREQVKGVPASTDFFYANSL